MQTDAFNTSELARYQRHVLLPQIGAHGQQQLKAAKVLCIGAGGLGAPALYYLAAAGVGTIGIVDADIVDISNLQRQILYIQADVGQKKVVQAKARLMAYNPHIHIDAYDTYLTKENALALIEKYDVIIDATDNYAARYLINDACFYRHKPMVYAGIYQFEGQASVFHYQGSPCYRCLYPAPPPAHLMQNCAQAGVLGVLPGILGSIQATEVIKIILALGTSLAGRLLTVDTLTMQFNQFPLQSDPGCCLCVHHQDFLSLPYHEPLTCEIRDMITPSELRQLYESNTDFFLLDVRQPDEYQRGHLPHSQLIPLNLLTEQLEHIPKDKPIIVYCQLGIRSQTAVSLLKQAGFSQLQSLEGGLSAWEKEEAVRSAK